MTNEELFIAGDFDTLYLKNERYITYTCKRFLNTGIEWDELVSLCNIAFTKALKVFNAYKSKWITFYSRCAENEILMYLRQQKRWNKNVSLDTPLREDAEGNSLTIKELLQDQISVENDVISNMSRKDALDLINKLSDKEQQIIQLRLQNLNQYVIGQQLNLSQSYVSRLEKQAINKLKKMYERSGYLMGKNKNSKNNKPFNPPVRHPQNMALVAKQLEKEIDAVRLESSNQALNLSASAFIIVLKEFYEFDKDKLQDVMNKVFEQLELCGKELVSLDQMMDLCEEYGIEVKKDTDKIDSIGKQMQDKLKVYELLDKGITEVEDIANQAKITSRDASAFRWQYNKSKYGKDYGGDVEMTAKKEEAFRLFDEGITATEVAKTIGIAKGTAFNWQAEYRKSAKVETVPQSVEELADKIFEEEEKTMEIKEKSNPEVTPKKPSRLKEQSRTVDYRGEFGGYQVSNNLVVVQLDTDSMSLEKDHLNNLIEELKEVAEQM